MPELPEVEAIAQTLRPLVAGRKIRCVHVFHAIATKPQAPAQLARTAEGQKIQSVQRKGKYLWLRLTKGIMTFHFKLDGQLLWFSNTKELLAKANKPKPEPSVHVDVALELDKGVLGFADGRHFGRVQVYDSAEAYPAVAGLGIDAISRDFSAKKLAALLATSKRPIKEFLLDQSRIAGIGNVYSCESLWHARLHPGRPANSITPAEARRLYKAIVSVLARALECCLHPPPNFRDATWWFQGIEKILRVYDREGKLCRRDGRPIERISRGGRSTYFCAHCQK
jgi:formamidopyrimidine-DNA glycosylase